MASPRFEAESAILYNIYILLGGATDLPLQFRESVDNNLSIYPIFYHSMRIVRSAGSLLYVPWAGGTTISRSFPLSGKDIKRANFDAFFVSSLEGNRNNDKCLVSIVFTEFGGSD